MQTIFEHANVLAAQLANEVEQQYNRLKSDAADTAIQISVIRTATESAVALEDEHLEEIIGTLRAQASARKLTLTEEGRKRIQFQQDRLNQIEEQLKQFAPSPSLVA